MPPGRHALPLDESASASLGAPPAPPAGWYADCADATEWHWWSGEEWSERAHPRDRGIIDLYMPAGDSETNGPSPAFTEVRVEDSRGNTPDLRDRIPAQSLLELIVDLHAEGGFEASRDGRRLYPTKEVKSWYDGAIGERRVAAILASLGPEWTVLHSVPVGRDGSDIDHVLIGPAGVFTLNTKHHRDKSAWVAGNTMMIDGTKVPYIYKATSEARSAAAALSKASGLTVEVAGLIVLVGTSTLTIRERPNPGNVTVAVVEDRDLLYSLSTRRLYSDEQVLRITDAAAQPATWSPMPYSAGNPVALATAFEGIESAVQAGGTRQGRLDRIENALGAASAPQSRPARSKAFRTRPPRPAPQRTSKSSGRKKKGGSFADLVKFLGAIVIVVIALNVAGNAITGASRTATTYATADAEQLALVQAAGTAAFVLDKNSPDGVRPASPVLSADGTLLSTPDGVALVQLPPATTIAYTPSANAHSYTLVLTGAEHHSSVTVTPEGGVVRG